MDKPHNHVMQQRVWVSQFGTLLLCITQYYVIYKFLQVCVCATGEIKAYSFAKK